MVLALAAFAGAQELRIFHIDVEQGEATLFVSPAGNTLLVDSGKNGHGKRIKAVMQQQGLTRIDHFVNTHYHEDHYGGIDDLVNDPEIEVVRGYDRGDKECCLKASKRDEVSFRDYEAAIGHRAEHLQRGMAIPLDADMSVLCISSGGVVLGEQDPQTGADENDMSISLLVGFAGFRYFVGGDIESRTEQKIADLGQVRDVDVYLADHHGSHTSSSSDFMRALQPTVVVISNGSVSRYMHPRQSTLTAMASLSPVPSIFQTNRYLGDEPEAGNVPLPFIADPESGDQDGLITITVNARQYTVAYGDQSHVFDVKHPAAPAAALRIARLLPDPVGDDRLLEEVVLRNDGSSAIDLEGWRLQDEGGRVWLLTPAGSIGAGSELSIRRDGMAMSLNNGGDEISLIDPSEAVVDRLRYDGSREGVFVEAEPD